MNAWINEWAVIPYMNDLPWMSCYEWAAMNELIWMSYYAWSAMNAMNEWLDVKLSYEDQHPSATAPAQVPFLAPVFLPPVAHVIFISQAQQASTSQAQQAFTSQAQQASTSQTQQVLSVCCRAWPMSSL
jgi:hypothetical protein